MKFKSLVLNPRTDFENIPPMESIIFWERGFDGNNYEDSPFTGFVDEKGNLYMYPEVPMGKLYTQETEFVKAWSLIGNLEKE